MIQKKLCVLGASGVGKTSLIKQYVEGIFSDKYLTSIGVKIDKKTVQLNDFNVQLMLWDIEGIDRYSVFNPKYLRGAAVVIIVVDPTRPQSLHEGIDIANRVKATKNIPIVLTLNKSDLPAAENWEIIINQDSQALFEAKYKNSAKQNIGIEKMFFEVAKLAVIQR
jgi:small GTP-binding protein